MVLVSVLLNGVFVTELASRRGTSAARGSAGGDGCENGAVLSRTKAEESSPVESAAGAVGKALVILETLVESPRPLSLGAVVERTRIPKSTAHRVLSLLVERGWVRQTGQGYALGHVLLRAAASAEASFDVRREAQPFLEQLRDDLDETVHLAMLDQEYRSVYLDKLVPRFQAVGLMRSRVGWTAPSYCTAVGKAMLACLPEQEIEQVLGAMEYETFTSRTITDADELGEELQRVRRSNFAICDEEHEEGVSCVAAAIRGRNGEPLAAISVSGPTSRMSKHLKAESECVKRVCETARALSALFGDAARCAGLG